MEGGKLPRQTACWGLIRIVAVVRFPPRSSTTKQREVTEEDDKCLSPATPLALTCGCELDCCCGMPNNFEIFLRYHNIHVSKAAEVA